MACRLFSFVDHEQPQKLRELNLSIPVGDILINSKALGWGVLIVAAGVSYFYAKWVVEICQKTT